MFAPGAPLQVWRQRQLRRAEIHAARSDGGNFVFDAGPGKREKKATMNLKRWIVWLCLAVIVVSEFMLFRANQQRTEAVDQRNKYQHEADQARKDLDEFKASAAAAQGAEGDRLRRENQRLIQSLTQLKDETNRLQKANQQLTQQLASLGKTAQQQQSRLQQWETASRQASAAVQQAQTQAQSRAETDRRACIANLKLIDVAKLQWALENNKTEDAIPTAQDLASYYKDGVVPVCPSGGVYTLNAVGQAPTCSIPGHALPP
jgi:methyl-accepting chemotaxis protein